MKRICLIRSLQSVVKCYSETVLLFACVPLFGLYSCTDNDNENSSAQVAVTFTPEIEGAGTRAVDQSWTSGDKVGVCMVTDGAALPSASEFNQYQVSGAGTSVGLSPVTTDQTLFYPTDGSNVNFVAFSPYATVTDNTITYTTFASQSTQADMEKVDFLYHKGTTAYNKTSTSAPLAFGHKLSKIIINATTTSNEDGTVTLSSLNTQITGTPGSVSVNLADGSITAGGSNATITPYHTNGSDTRVATAIIVPHSAKAGRTITFTDGEGSYSYTLPSDDFTFEPNKVYTINFRITRQGVTLIDVAIDNWSTGTIEWTGKYMFELLNDSFSLTAAANTTTTMTFNSNSGAAPTVVLSTSETDAHAGAPAWVTGALTTSSKTGYTAYTYKFNVTANEAGPFRTAYAHILNGSTSLGVVPVKQKGTYEYPNNSYIVKSGNKNILIPVSRANEHAAWVGDEDAKIADNDVLTASILWSDVQNLVAVETVGEGASGAIKVKTTGTANIEGNALVAVKVNNVIKWSWHIWVTNYEPTPIGELGWMDRNLGATSNSKSTVEAERVKTFGLLYQWGRKDPFPGSAGDNTFFEGIEPTLYSGDGTSFTYGMKDTELMGLGAATLSKYAQSISYTIQNPMTYIAVSNSWQSSPTSTSTNNNWGYKAGKELYDPCPEGYRVPKNGSWGTSDWNTTYPWQDNYKGRDVFPYGGWYAADGLRIGTTGMLILVGTGCGWSATPSGVGSGYHLSFDSTSFNPMGDNNRASGFGVRCISE